MQHKTHNSNRLRASLFISYIMAIPTYDELLVKHDMEKFIMKQTFDDKDLRQFSLTLDMWEILAKFLEMPNPDIANIKSQGEAAGQKIRMLESWKQRCGSMATYEVMVKALLKISRTDLAEKVIEFRVPSRDTPTLETATSNQKLSYPQESSQTAPTSLASSSGIEDACSPAATAAVSPSSLPAMSCEYLAQRVTQSLQELEEEFLQLVIFIENTLDNSQVNLNTIIRRFSMLPQSVKRKHETDENYKETRRKILESKTVKQLFNNLTELKHWNFMMPDILAHILRGVEIDAVIKKIDEYKHKLVAFKANTKLRELIGISFPVPDYCLELIMKVEGWEDKTIQEVENRAVNIVRRAVYSGGPQVSLGWKGVISGCIEVTFVLMESVKLIPERLLEDSEVVCVQVDGDVFHSKDYSKLKVRHSHRVYYPSPLHTHTHMIMHMPTITVIWDCYRSQGTGTW